MQEAFKRSLSLQCGTRLLDEKWVVPHEVSTRNLGFITMQTSGDEEDSRCFCSVSSNLG